MEDVVLAACPLGLPVGGVWAPRVARQMPTARSTWQGPFFVETWVQRRPSGRISSMFFSANPGSWIHWVYRAIGPESWSPERGRRRAWGGMRGAWKKRRRARGMNEGLPLTFYPALLGKSLTASRETKKTTHPVDLHPNLQGSCVPQMVISIVCYRAASPPSPVKNRVKTETVVGKA